MPKGRLWIIVILIFNISSLVLGRVKMWIIIEMVDQLVFVPFIGLTIQLLPGIELPSFLNFSLSPPRRRKRTKNVKAPRYAVHTLHRDHLFYMCRRDIRKHLTFVNSNYNILLTLSLKLLIQYQLSQREAFFRRDAYLPFFIVEFFQQKVKKMRTVIIFENLLSKTWPSCWSSNLIGAYQSLFFSSEMERLKLEIN